MRSSDLAVADAAGIQSFEAAVFSGSFCLMMSAWMVTPGDWPGRQVRRSVIILVLLERAIAQVAPQHRRQPHLVGVRECLGYFDICRALWSEPK